jgi:hypothetical protein
MKTGEKQQPRNQTKMFIKVKAIPTTGSEGP